MNPEHVNELQWHQSMGYARQACARVFRDGGAPADALKAFGLERSAHAVTTWDKAVEMVAGVLCDAAPKRRAA